MERQILIQEKKDFFAFLDSQFLSLTFDDVLLKTAYSSVMPDNTDLSTQFSKNIRLKIPLVSAAMDTVTQDKMAIAIAKKGGLGIIHKNMKIKNQAKMILKVKNKDFLVGAAISPGKEGIKRAEQLIWAGADVLVLDSAHADSKNIFDTIKEIKNNYPVDLVAGNITESQSARRLCDLGVDGIKVGQGPGSICSTRVIAGIGRPQISAIYDCFKIANEYEIPVCADGGIRYSGDIGKAIAAGASSVMLGNLLSGTKESPGKTLSINNQKVKVYRGMGSYEAMTENVESRRRYLQSGKGDIVPEGVESVIKFKGSVVGITNLLVGGLRRTLGYTGSKNIPELISQGKFTRTTLASKIESHPHDIQISGERINY